MKVEEGKKLEKYLDLAKESKKLWDMKVKMIPIVVGALETVPKNLEKRLNELEIKGELKPSRPQQYLEEFWRLEETCCHSDFSEKPTVKADMKTLQGEK